MARSQDQQEEITFRRLPPQASLPVNSSLALSGTLSGFKVSILCTPVADSDARLEVVVDEIQLFQCLSAAALPQVGKGSGGPKAMSVAPLVVLCPAMSARVTDATSPQDCFSCQISKIVVTMATAFGLRTDYSKPIHLTSSQVEEAEITFSLEQLEELLVLKEVWVAEAEQAKAAIDESYTLVGSMEKGGGSASAAASSRSNVSFRDVVEAVRERQALLVASASASVVTRLFLARLVVNSRVGLSVGNQELSLYPVHFHLFNRGRLLKKARKDCTLLRFGIGTVSGSFDGHLTGGLLLNGIGVEVLRLYPVPPAGLSLRKAINKFRGAIGNSRCDVYYNGSRVITLNAGGHCLRFRDRFVAPFDGSGCLMEVVATSSGFSFGMSSEAMETLSRLSSVLLEYYEEQEAAASRLLSRLARWRTKDEKPLAESAAASPAALPHVGDVTCLVRIVDVSLFKETMKDREYLHLTTDSMRLNVGTTAAESTIVRGLSLFFSDTVMEKGISVEGGAATPIIRIVGGLVEMFSRENTDANELQYQFTSKFRDRIIVSTNIGDYHFMREVFARIGSNSEFAVTRSHDRVASLPSAAESAAESAAAASDRLTYVSKKFELEPVISFLGNLTPRVETVLSWMGIEDHTNAIPRAVHEKLTLNVELLLSLCAQITQRLDATFP